MDKPMQCERCGQVDLYQVMCSLHKAAPALLEALEAMCERYDAPHWAVNIKARAAIAQARGDRS